MSTFVGRGSIDNGFSFNNIFLASGDFAQSATAAQAALSPGYNYLNYTPQSSADVIFYVNTGTSDTIQYVVRDWLGANSNGSGSPHIVISGAAGAGYKFNGQNSVIVSGSYASKTVALISGNQWMVF